MVRRQQECGFHQQVSGKYVYDESKTNLPWCTPDFHQQCVTFFIYGNPMALIHPMALPLGFHGKTSHAE